MSKLTETIKKELYEMIPPTLFFFVALHIVALIRALMAKGSGIPDQGSTGKAGWQVRPQITPTAC